MHAFFILRVQQQCTMKEHSIVNRFFDYVKIYTTADPHSDSYPSSERQKDLGRHLYQELRDLGLEDVEMDEHGLIYATIPSNVPHEVPVICFCSHMDTSPDSPGKDVRPLLHQKYDGSDIILPDDTSQVLTIDEHPDLAKKIGEDIITASGLTLLGADDKSGIAVIMAMTEHLLRHPDIPHGKIRILFTCDEEIGRGVDKVDMEKLGADFGYTLDGSDTGTIEDETFSADAIHVHIDGKAEHPGYAFGKLVSALKVAAAFVDELPFDRLSPETTTGKSGFIHPVRMTGTAEQAEIDFIIRDFVTEGLDEKAEYLERIQKTMENRYKGCQIEMTRTEQYRNMKYVLDEHPQVTEYAMEAMEKAGLEVHKASVRGGTDGSRLSFMGLPCPNLFTGQHGIHSRQEWISLQDMERSCHTLVELVQIWAERSR